MPSDDVTSGGPRQFATTRWSLVVAAGAGRSAQADRALAELCADYWYPLYAFVRRRGHDADDARDLTQAFFTKLLEKNDLKAADPARGRFRSFLLTAMKNFLASEWRRQAAVKRGGGVELVSIDYRDAEDRYQVEPADALTPEAIYERRWALGLLARAVEELRTQYVARGQTELFDTLKGYLGSDPGGVPYGELSRRFEQSEAALRTALSRLRARWRDRLREIVAETVQEGRMVDDELNDLIGALTPPAGKSL
ncbi:MAG: sigma-70 family RNA polymerase sigma factor [Dehalococcoidia bacterium]|jgi:RNA polymerase sigma-70 factor (ECF subfamily)|nr:sigma-70 family RNA polymerase sigma factor [Dehalococcoidia bacterium]